MYWSVFVELPSCVWGSRQPETFSLKTGGKPLRLLDQFHVCPVTHAYPVTHMHIPFTGSVPWSVTLLHIIMRFPFDDPGCLSVRGLSEMSAVWIFCSVMFPSFQIINQFQWSWPAWKDQWHADGVIYNCISQQALIRQVKNVTWLWQSYIYISYRHGHSLWHIQARVFIVTYTDCKACI